MKETERETERGGEGRGDLFLKLQYARYLVTATVRKKGNTRVLSPLPHHGPSRAQSVKGSPVACWLTTELLSSRHTLIWAWLELCNKICRRL